jgi:glycosyltransferase involved in cell wall biosynthesis
VKILYHHRIRSKDGQSVHLEELIAALRGLGHEVVIAGPESFARASFGDDPKLLGMVKKLLPKAVYEVLELAYNIPAYRRLYRLWRQERPDALYERCNLYLLAGVWLKKRMGVAMLLEVNAPLARERAAYGGLGLPLLARRLEQWVWRSADFVLPVTNVLAGEVHAAGVPANNIIVIPNAIDPARFLQQPDAAAAKMALGLSGKLVLGFTGFMRDWHGLDSVIDWLAEPQAPRDIHLLLVGDGPALPGLKAQAEKRAVADRITFAGLVDRSMVAKMVAAFDIALQPKSVEYASPLKLFEYMALGKAIIAPDQPNIREVLQPGISGLLFDPMRPASLTTAITRLAADGALRASLGAEARKTIAARDYTWTGNARQVASLAQAAQGRGRVDCSSGAPKNHANFR